MPGADVTAKHNATDAVSRTVTDTDGHFTIPALQPGMYTVTVSLMGFKTASYPEVQILTATPATLDSIEEISVSTSTPGAEASGQGAKL